MQCPHDTQVAMSLLLGYLGCVNILLFGVPLLVCVLAGPLDVSGLTWVVIGALVANGLVDYVISDYLWARACLLTSPTVATVGLSLTVRDTPQTQLFIYFMILFL